MRAPAVFVSSTCYDLKQVRANFKDFLEDLGLEPILSEYNNFPVNPHLGTVDNCIKAVESKADILVLIVGGRYGSTTEHGKSITNLEFQTAIAKGIPVYAFVDRSVLDFLKVWKKNPTADFSNVSDSPKLFEFVSDLKEKEGIWIFPFVTAQDIFKVLRTQLAYLFRDALELRQQATKHGGLTENLRKLHGTALRLVIERPRGWEFLFYSEVLENEMKRHSNLKRDWEYGIAMGVGTHMNPSQYLEWNQNKISEAIRIVENIDQIINQAAKDGFGPQGIEGNAETILYAAQKLGFIYQHILEWKLDYFRIAVPDEVERLRSISANLLNNTIEDTEKFARTLKATIKEVLAAPQSGQERVVNISFSLTPPDLNEYEKELGRITALIDSGELDWD